MTAQPWNAPVTDLYARLAPRLTGDTQRQLLRELLEQLAAGGAEAVRADVRQRVRTILGEEP